MIRRVDALVVGSVVAAAALIAGAMQPGTSAPGTVSTAPKAPAASAGGGQGPVTPELVMEMVKTMKAMPECLGVELVQSQSGSRVIMAWFENKAALMAWYKNDVHRKAMDRVQLPADGDNRETLEGVSDDSGPLMALAAMKQGPDGQALSIEIYSATTAGANWGNFAPAKVHEVAKAHELAKGKAKPTGK